MRASVRRDGIDQCHRNLTVFFFQRTLNGFRSQNGKICTKTFQLKFLYQELFFLSSVSWIHLTAREAARSGFHRSDDFLQSHHVWCKDSALFDGLSPPYAIFATHQAASCEALAAVHREALSKHRQPSVLTRCEPKRRYLCL